MNRPGERRLSPFTNRRSTTPVQIQGKYTCDTVKNSQRNGDELVSETRWQEDLQFAVDTACRAGELAMKYFIAGVEFSKKDDDSPITIADRECEAYIRSRLGQRYPNDAMLGEEEGESAPAVNGRKWIIDPIDGTYNFARGVPVFSVLIALEEAGDIVAGVVHNPAMQETYAASRGRGAFKNGRTIHVSQTQSMADAYLVFGEPVRLLEKNLWGGFGNLLKATYKHRGFGDYLSFGVVFEGKADVGIEVGVKAWDLAPMKVIVEEAGGRFTDLNGNGDIYSGSTMFSNGKFHTEALKLLTCSPQPVSGQVG